MQSAILFLAMKVAKVGPKTVVQPSPDSAVYLKWLIALILISRRGIEWLIALIFPFTGILEDPNKKFVSFSLCPGAYSLWWLSRFLA